MYWNGRCSWRGGRMSPSILDQISLMSLENYKNTRFENTRMSSPSFNKLIQEHFRRNSECERPGFLHHHHARDQHWSTNKRSNESKSLCLRGLRSMWWSDGTRCRSRRKKMERPSWRSHDESIILRWSGNRWRSNCIRVDNFQLFSIQPILIEIQKDLQEKNIQPENFEDQIIFMSIAEKVNCAKKFVPRHWTLLGLGSKNV